MCAHAPPPVTAMSRCILHTQDNYWSHRVVGTWPFQIKVASTLGEVRVRVRTVAALDKGIYIIQNLGRMFNAACATLTKLGDSTNFRPSSKCVFHCAARTRRTDAPIPSMQRFAPSHRALSRLVSFNRVPRRTLANVSADILRDASTPSAPPMSPLSTRGSPANLQNGLATYRRSFLPLTGLTSHIRFNPASDSSFAPQRAVSQFISSLHAHFDTLPSDPHAPASAARFRQYSRAVVLPFEDKPRVYWSPGHFKDGQDITYYNQGTGVSLPSAYEC